MIILVTGVPGSGKTAWVVDYLLNLPKDRPLYIDGVPELTIPHEKCPPLADWTVEADDPSSQSGKKISFAFPAGAMVVIDECQRVYRPRPTGAKVPPEVAAFETHRHLGLDFILITQGPGLIDANIRKLVGKHLHFRSTWAGRYKHEWSECADVESTTARGLAATERYRLPKRAFEHYKSAEVHTKQKHKIPIVAYVVIAALLGCGVFGWRVYNRVSGAIGGETEQAKAAKPGVSGRQVSGRVESGGSSGVMTKAEYLESLVPRVEGWPHTASRYDKLTEATDAPWPSACLIVHAWKDRPERCRCVDQQGNDYQTTDDICRGIVAKGIFKDWGQSATVEAKSRAVPPAGSPVPVEPQVAGPV